MGKRVSYNVQGETFPTRKSLESRIRKIVASYLVGNRLNRPDTEFMLDVLRRHKDWEEKRGPGVVINIWKHWHIVDWSNSATSHPRRDDDES